MTTNNQTNTSYLCGGTLFNLILLARKPRLKARQREMGMKDNLNIGNVLAGLVFIVTGNKEKVDEKSMQKSASTFKACSISANTYIPFDDKNTINNFDILVKEDRNTAIDRVIKFADEVIDTNKQAWLVKAILELIENDNDINYNDGFLIDKDTKASSIGAPHSTAQGTYLKDELLKFQGSWPHLSIAWRRRLKRFALHLEPIVRKLPVKLP